MHELYNPKITGTRKDATYNESTKTRVLTFIVSSKKIGLIGHPFQKEN